MKMPVAFFAHGSPMNAIQMNSFTEFVSSVHSLFPTPKAILVISAHWETQDTMVLGMESPRTIHDFGGFPRELYEIQYPCVGSPSIAKRISDLTHAKIDSNWGLDHGSWTILKYLYPKANIPTLQLSINRQFSLKDHYDFAQKLKPLRDEGVLIIGSGNITHNLRRIDFSQSVGDQAWAVEFDQMIKEALENKDIETLTEFGTRKHLWDLSHPTLEHYIPLLYIIGASDESERVQFLFEGMELSSLSMRSFMF